MSKVIEPGEVKKIIERFKKPISSKSSQAVTKAMRSSANYVYQQSQQLVPYDTGALHASGRVLQVGLGVDTQLQVTYGSPEVPYAIDVHENPPAIQVHGYMYNEKYAEQIREGKRKRREPQEQFQYLEDAVDLGRLKAIFRKDLF